MRATYLTYYLCMIQNLQSNHVVAKGLMRWSSRHYTHGKHGKHNSKCQHIKAFYVLFCFVFLRGDDVIRGLKIYTQQPIIH